MTSFEDVRFHVFGFWIVMDSLNGCFHHTTCVARMPWKRRQCSRPCSVPRWGSQGRKGFTFLAGGKLYLKSPDFTMVYHYMLYIDAWRLLHLIEYPPLRDWWKFLSLISISNLYAESWLGPFDQETRGKQHCFTWPLNWFPTTKAQVWLRQAAACRPWARCGWGWFHLGGQRTSQTSVTTTTKKEDTPRLRHWSCLMFPMCTCALFRVERWRFPCFSVTGG